MTGTKTVAYLVLVVAIAACGNASTVFQGPKEAPDVALDPPTAEAGWQWKTGTFDVSNGQEVQQCFFFRVPSTEKTFVHRIDVAQTAGTHHMNVFRVRTVKNLSGGDGDVVVDGECWTASNWSDWPLVINSQTAGRVEVTLPEGVAHGFEPGELLMLQTHYVNANTQKTPNRASVFVNFYTMSPSPPPVELGAAFATNQQIRICPGTTPTYSATCRFAHDGPVRIFAANGHFHSRGAEFTMSVYDAASDKPEMTPFYDSSTWSEPIYEMNLNIGVPASGGISYSCSYSASPSACGNPTDECCFTFGGKVETQEHCNAFVYYYPRGTTDVNCF